MKAIALLLAVVAVLGGLISLQLGLAGKTATTKALGFVSLAVAVFGVWLGVSTYDESVRSEFAITYRPEQLFFPGAGDRGVAGLTTSQRLQAEQAGMSAMEGLDTSDMNAMRAVEGLSKESK